jgi:hypothetical protein
MNKLKLICWLLIVSGFLFGMSDRWLQADLNSLGIAAIFSVLVVPLNPLFK